MINAYDRMLQQEAEEWFEGYDHDTTLGLIQEMTGLAIETDEDLEIYKETGIF